MPAVRKTRNKLYRRLNHRQVFTCVCLRTFFCSSISMGLQYFWILRKDFFFEIRKRFPHFIRRLIIHHPFSRSIDRPIH
jgi:hypothetical protein